MNAADPVIRQATIVAILDEPVGPIRRSAAHRPGLSARDLRRLCVMLAEAAEDTRIAARVLKEEAEAVRLTMAAIGRIGETTEAVLDHFMTVEARHAEGLADARASIDDETVLPGIDLDRLLRPLALAASAATAVNASITSSSMALTEASLRIVRAGERHVEATRLPERG
jgi:hypothetical protein